jgi:hypothetical protein
LAYILTDIGEEWYTKTNLDSASVTFSLYNDGTDAISDGDDIAAVTTEPSGASYSRLSDTVSAVKLSGDWGFDNDNDVILDVSDSSQTVDGVLMLATFTSSETGDSSATQHLVATAQLSQTTDLSQVDELQISAGEAGVTVN